MCAIRSLGPCYICYLSQFSLSRLRWIARWSFDKFINCRLVFPKEICNIYRNIEKMFPEFWCRVDWWRLLVLSVPSTLYSIVRTFKSMFKPSFGDYITAHDAEVCEDIIGCTARTVQYTCTHQPGVQCQDSLSLGLSMDVHYIHVKVPHP